MDRQTDGQRKEGQTDEGQTEPPGPRGEPYLDVPAGRGPRLASLLARTPGPGARGDPGGRLALPRPCPPCPAPSLRASPPPRAGSAPVGGERAPGPPARPVGGRARPRPASRPRPGPPPEFRPGLTREAAGKEAGRRPGTPAAGDRPPAPPEWESPRPPRREGPARPPRTPTRGEVSKVTGAHARGNQTRALRACMQTNVHACKHTYMHACIHARVPPKLPVPKPNR